MGGGTLRTGRSRPRPRPLREPPGERPLTNDLDLQSLLAGGVSRLATASGCERVAAWGWSEDGAPTVLAASLDGPARLDPSPRVMRALAELDRATDLGARGATGALAALPAEQGLTAAAPLRAGHQAAVAFLLAGGSLDPAGSVRPRTLAALDAAARRLSLPVAATLAAQRLARLDAEVRRIDRLATLGELATEIVHEIRNPLVSVKTFLQLLPERADDVEFRESFLAVAGEELRRLERLIDGVLAHARPADRGDGDVAAAVEAARLLVAQRAAQREVTLAIEIPEGLPSVALGADALRQVALNLLLNALDASPAPGIVQVRAATARGHVTVEVADEGPGVPAPLREQLFEPFVTTREGRPGGLGLAISRRLVEEVGGRLELADASDTGSIFRVQLPIAADPLPR